MVHRRLKTMAKHGKTVVHKLRLLCSSSATSRSKVPTSKSFLDGPGEQPNLNVEVSVKARRVRENLYESSINFTANASSSIGVIYDLEISYGGLFQITDMPEEALEPFLLINCPSILFPFLRRIVADLTREGSFPPLYLDPIDFAALYTQRQQSNNAGGDEDSTPERLN